MKKIILIIMLVLVSCFVHAQGTQFFWEQIKPIDAQVELMAPDTDDLLLIQDVSDGDLRKSVKVGSIFDMRLPIDTIPTDIVDANWQEYIANHSEGSAWTVDVNGVNYQTGNVGVGTESASHSGLSVVNDYTFAGLYVRNNIATGNVYGIHSTVMSTGSSNAIAGYVNNGGVNSAAVRGTNSSTTTELHYGAVFESALGSNGIAVSARGGLVDIQSGLTGIIQTKERASSSDTPISGFGNWYFKDDGLPYGMNDAGTEYDLTATGGWNYDVQAITTSWDVDNGLGATTTLSANLSIDLSNLEAGMSGNLTVTNAATSYTVTFTGYTIIVAPYLGATGDAIPMSGSSVKDVLSWWYDGTQVIVNGTLGYE